MKTILLSIITCISLLYSCSSSPAYSFSGSCILGDVAYDSIAYCATGYTGSRDIFYSVESTTNISDMNYNIVLSGTIIHFKNTNGLFGASIDDCIINYSDGIEGPPGLSIYETAVNLGYTGTVWEYLESMRGPKGATGETMIVFSTGQIFSGVTMTIDNGESDTLLSTGSTYIPFLAKYNGEYLINWNGFRNLLFILAITFGTFYFIFRYTIGKKSSLG